MRRIPLRGLAEPDVRGFLRATVGGPATDARTARLLHEATGGNPLFLREIVRELPVGGLLRTVPVTPTVRDMVAARYDRIAGADGAVLDAAAVLGTEFEARTCPQVLGAPVIDVLDALDRAAAPGAVVAVPDATGRFTFSRAVVREVRYEAIAAGQRMRLHRAAGSVLRNVGAPVTELARHFCAAADLGDPEDAFRGSNPSPSASTSHRRPGSAPARRDARTLIGRGRGKVVWVDRPRAPGTVADEDRGRSVSPTPRGRYDVTDVIETRAEGGLNGPYSLGPDGLLAVLTVAAATVRSAFTAPMP